MENTRKIATRPDYEEEENEIIGRRIDSLTTRVQGSFTTLVTFFLQPPYVDLHKTLVCNFKP